LYSNKVANKVSSNIILTSDTLFPFESLENELQVEFPIKFDSSHIVDSSRIKSAILSKGVNGTPFEFIWKQRDNSNMFVDLGETLVKIVQTVPGGVVLLVPSYSFLGTITSVWVSNSLITKMSNYK
jgi:chromosome transmission fidelity protein 1